MNKLVRFFVIRRIAGLIKKAFRRMPKAEQEFLMQKWFQSRGQWARVIAIIGTALTGLAAAFGLHIDWLPLIGKIADAIEKGDINALLATVGAFLFAVWKFFDRQAEERRHAELIKTATKTE